MKIFNKMLKTSEIQAMKQLEGVKISMERVEPGWFMCDITTPDVATMQQCLAIIK